MMITTSQAAALVCQQLLAKEQGKGVLRAQLVRMKSRHGFFTVSEFLEKAPVAENRLGGLHR